MANAKSKTKKRKLPRGGSSTAPPVKDSLSVGWKPRERAIYRYWNGQKEVAADPVELDYGLQEYPDWDAAHKLMAAAEDGDPPAGLQNKVDEVFREVVAVIRKAFGVKTLTEGGLTAGECWALYLDFQGWIMELKKKAGLLPSSAAPTAAGLGDPSPTPSTSASPSAGATSKEGEPILSPDDLPTPSPEMAGVWENRPRSTSCPAPA